MKKKPSERLHQEEELELEEKVKSAYQEEGKDVSLTGDFKEDLLSRMKQVRDEEWVTEDEHSAARQAGSPGRVQRIREFLNREVEIPLVPLVAASLLIMVINYYPAGYEPRPEGRMIEIGGSQLWIPDNGEGVEMDDEG